MSAGQTIILSGANSRKQAKQLIDSAPMYAVCNIRPSGRTSDQNSRMWAMLSDVSRAMPEGRRLTPDMWKAVFMNAVGHAVQFETGLSGEPFPVGFRSSRLTKAQMGELMDFIESYGNQHGVVWSEPMDRRG